MKVWPRWQLCSVQRVVLRRSEAKLIGSHTLLMKSVEQFHINMFQDLITQFFPVAALSDASQIVTAPDLS